MAYQNLPAEKQMGGTSNPMPRLQRRPASFGGSTQGGTGTGAGVSTGTPYGGKYTRQAADVNYNYGRQAANNAYGRFLSQQRGSRNLGDMQRNFQRSFPGYAASFAQRGMSGPGIQSGVQQQSYRNYLGDYGRAYGRMQQDATQELQQFDLSQADLDAWRQASLRAIEEERAMEVAQTAANLDYLKQMLGGL